MNQTDIIPETVQAFKATFGHTPAFVASAPGRVNLIGEHTDYNNGYVFPVAINRKTVIAASPRNDQTLHIHAHNFNASISVPLSRLQRTREQSWSNYSKGVASVLQDEGKVLTGTNLLINSDIPNGAGLSSSAALEMSTAYALLAVGALSLPPLEIIHVCHDAEFEFVGVHCGIMDQFISCLGKRNHALFLDCQTLRYEHVPIPEGCNLVVCDTGVKRSLAGSEYNIRRQQCSEGAQQLSYVMPSVKTLRDVSVKEFEEQKGRLGDVIRKRCRHVVYENERVLNSVRALRQNDLSDFGKLMYQSHMSLKNDYEVSCAELDAVVDICAEVDGVYGARMTGAGFGGAAICLVQHEQAESVVQRLHTEYPRVTGRIPVIQICTVEDGAQVKPWT
ncbi:MAG TPA: galactokinase [Bacteroidota bacterium]|nr:galactokinase [Bacteroidota bacterium]